MATAKKAAAKKPAAKKAAVKKAPVKKVAAKKAPAKAPVKTTVASAAVGKPNIKATPLKPITAKHSKSSLMAHVAQHANVDLKAVKAVFASLEATMMAAIHKKGAGVFVLPGLLKATALHIPAKPKREGINPFTKEKQIFAAKPATIKVKVRPMKKLVDAAK